MEIKSTEKKATELKKGDFVTDINPNTKGAFLGVVTSNEGEELNVSLYTEKDSPYFTEGKISKFAKGNTLWDVLTKEEAIKFIAKNNPLGFTVRKDTLEPITEGYSVAVSETQNSFGDEGIERVLEVAKKSYIDAIGGWKEGEDYYFDAVMVVQDFDTAAELGYRNRQKAIFHLDEKKELVLVY